MWYNWSLLKGNDQLVFFNNWSQRTLIKEDYMGRPVLDLTSQVFGKLTVVGFAYTDAKASRAHWHCLCECGNKIVAAANNLKKGTSASCGFGGCSPNYKHGLRQHELYNTWNTMNQRCENPNNTGWSAYGGRGIKVCEEWRNSFEQFYKDMGERPPGHELDRKDNNLGYCKENCKWSTPLEQAQNRRNTMIVEYKGVKMLLTEAAELAGIPAYVLRKRVKAGTKDIFMPLRNN